MDRRVMNGNPARGQGRLARELGAKVAVWLALAVGICVPYFLLQRVSGFPLREIPVTPLDAGIGFAPGWIWAYASLALLVPLGPLLATRREQLARYGVGLALLCTACFAVFLFFPVLGPRPDVLPEQGLYHWIVARDRPSNSLPSLHAGLTFYSFLFGWRVLSGSLGLAGRLAYTGIAVLWGGAILYATLATKQHWALDLPPGIVLAALAHTVAWRSAPRD